MFETGVSCNSIKHGVCEVFQQWLKIREGLIIQ